LSLKSFIKKNKFHFPNLAGVEKDDLLEDFVLFLSQIYFIFVFAIIVIVLI